MIKKSLNLNQQDPPVDSTNQGGDSTTAFDCCAGRGYRGKSSSYWKAFMKWLCIFVATSIAWIVLSGSLYVCCRSSLHSWIVVLINPSNSLKILNSFGLASALAGFIIVQAYEHPNSSANGNQKLRAALSEESAKALGDALQLIGLYTALLMDYWFLISTILVAIVWAFVYFFKFRKSKKVKKQQKLTARHKKTAATIMAEAESVSVTAAEVE